MSDVSHCVCVCVCVFFWLIFNFFLNIHILAKFQHLVTKKQNWDCAYILQRIFIFIFEKMAQSCHNFRREKNLNIVGFQRNSTLLSLSLSLSLLCQTSPEEVITSPPISQILPQKKTPPQVYVVH
jgi:hypothetical protein